MRIQDEGIAIGRASSVWVLGLSHALHGKHLLRRESRTIEAFRNRFNAYGKLAEVDRVKEAP